MRSALSSAVPGRPFDALLRLGERLASDVGFGRHRLPLVIAPLGSAEPKHGRHDQKPPGLRSMPASVTLSWRFPRAQHTDANATGLVWRLCLLEVVARNGQGLALAGVLPGTVTK